MYENYELLHFKFGHNVIKCCKIHSTKFWSNSWTISWVVSCQSWNLDVCIRSLFINPVTIVLLVLVGCPKVGQYGCAHTYPTATPHALLLSTIIHNKLVWYHMGLCILFYSNKVLIRFNKGLATPLCNILAITALYSRPHTYLSNNKGYTICSYVHMLCILFCWWQ